MSAAQAAAKQSSRLETDVFGQVQTQGSMERKKSLSLDDVAALLKIKDPISDKLENPYTTLELWRMHDTYRRDGTARRSLNLLTDFTLGNRTLLSLDVTRDYPNKEEHDNAILDLRTRTDAQEIMAQIVKINRKVGFDHVLTSLMIQAKVFGRAVAVIQDDPETKLPIAVKNLNSMRLGRLFVNEITWQIEAVEYLDYHGTQSIIPADRMIYMANLDFGISPNCHGFGLSDYEVLMDNSETNRTIKEMDVKEACRSLWAPFVVFKLNSKKRSVMQAVKNQLKVGVPFIHNLDGELTIHDLHQTPIPLLEAADKLDHKIARDIGVPSFIVGFEDFPNRATAATLVDTFTISVLVKLRQWLKDAIEPQWISRIMMRLKNLQTRDEISDLEYKIELDFQTIAVQDLNNAATACDLLVRDNIIDTKKARDVMKMSDIDDRMEAEDAVRKEQLAKQVALTEKQVALAQGQQQLQQPGVGTGTSAKGEQPRGPPPEVLQHQPTTGAGRKQRQPPGAVGAAASADADADTSGDKDAGTIISIDNVDLLTQKKLDVLDSIKRHVDKQSKRADSK